MTTDRFIPPAAEGLPEGALDSATDGANALDARALDPYGRNFLAHALVQLARDGWLRTEPGESFEPVRDREAPEPATAVPVPPPADQTALRQRIAAALAARFTADGDLSQGMRVIDPNDEDDPNPARWVRPGEAADVVMAVLPEQTDRAAEAERPLSPDYEHPECGFHWHGRDGMDIPIRDGQPVCPRCELRRAEKLLAHRERRCQELREECLRRGKNVLARSLKIVALERQLDEVRSQLGAEILRAGQAETELRRVAAEEQPAETQDSRSLMRAHAALAEQAGRDQRALARIRQMADAWEQRLPEVIRTPAVVSAIRSALPDETDRPKPPPMDPVHILGIDAAPARPAVGEQPETQEARPSHHRWNTETLDNVANEWAPGMRFTDRAVALERYQAISVQYPLWKDGAPVRRRFVRETTSYTVEAPE